MIRRVTDPDELARLASACELPGTFDDGSDYLERANVLGWGDPMHGAVLFEPVDAHTVQAHVMVHPEHRGREAIQAGRDCLAAIRSLGLSVIGITPRDRKDAIAYARAVGLSIAGETHEHVYSFGGPHG